MTSRFAPLVLGFMLVLSGCAAVGGPTTATETPQDGTDTPQYDTANALPGVSNGTVAAPGALLAANADALTDEGYVAVRNWSTEYNATRRDTRQRIVSRVSADGRWLVTDVGWYTVPERARYKSLTAWSNGTVATYRDRDYENGTLVGTRYNSADVTHAPNESLGGDFVHTYLADGYYTHERTLTRDGRTLYVFSADGLAPGVGEDYVAGSFSGRLVVDERGRIRSFRAAYTVATDEATARFTLTYDLRRIGPVEIERPAFVAEAADDGHVYHCTDDTADYDCTSD